MNTDADFSHCRGAKMLLGSLLFQGVLLSHKSGSATPAGCASTQLGRLGGRQMLNTTLNAHYAVGICCSKQWFCQTSLCGCATPAGCAGAELGRYGGRQILHTILIWTLLQYCFPWVPKPAKPGLGLWVRLCKTCRRLGLTLIPISGPWSLCKAKLPVEVPWR